MKVSGIGDDIFSAVTNVVGMVPGLGTVAALAAKGIKTGIDAATGHDPNAPPPPPTHASDPEAHYRAEIAKLKAKDEQDLKRLHAEQAKERAIERELHRHEAIEKKVLFGVGVAGAGAVLAAGIALARRALR